MVTHSSILAWEIHGQRCLVGYSPCGHKELDMTSQLNNNNKNYSTMILLKLLVLEWMQRERIGSNSIRRLLQYDRQELMVT